jgi:asparagine synthase (glutamine-hydrolysing)
VVDYPEWIDESFAKRIELKDRVREVWSEPRLPEKRRPATIRALQSKVWTPLFEGYDPGATRLPLEVRHPFMDVRLVEYLLALPTKPWCVKKHILRQAMKGRLPESIINRPKTPLAGDPALQLMRRASVRWRDSFEVTPQLKRFVNLSHRRSLADENTPDAVWARLRLFALNHWLTHSLPLDRRMVA